MPDEFGREFEADAGEAIDKDSRTWGMLAHLSGLIAAIVGGGVLGFVGPLVVWLTKNNEDPFVDDQGKEALNFHLTFTLAYVVLGVAVAVTCGLAVVVVIVAAPIMILLQVIFSLIAALQANEGKYYRYPMNIRMIK